MNDKATMAGFQYPTNENGTPEYQSVIITLDHLSAGREGNPHIHNKFVFSTQDEVEALLALFAYYGESTLGLNARTVKVMGEMFTKDYPVLAYQTTTNTELVLAMDTFIELINNDTFGDGSIFMAVERIVQMYQRMAIDILGNAPEGARHAPFGFELEVAQAEQFPAGRAPGEDHDGPNELDRKTS
jgi:hypothetical protein